MLTYPLLFVKIPCMSTITLTSKNQITIPVRLLREKSLKRGTKLQARWEGNDLVLSPQEDLEKVVSDMQAHLRPLIRKPLSDAELKKNLRNWPNG